MKYATPTPNKVTPSFPTTPSKVEVLSSPPPLFENLVGAQPPPPQQKGGAHYVFYGYPGREWVTDVPVKMLVEAGDNFFRA